MFTVQCPHCQARLSLDENLAGRRARCPKCRKAFRAPEAISEEAVGFPPWLLAFCGAAIALMILLSLFAVLGLIWSVFLLLGVAAIVVGFLYGPLWLERLQKLRMDVPRSSRSSNPETQRVVEDRAGMSAPTGDRLSTEVAPRRAKSGPVTSSRSFRNEPAFDEHSHSIRNEIDESAPSSTVFAQPTPLSYRTESLPRASLIEIQTSRRGRSGVPIPPRSARRSFSSSVSRWIGAPSTEDVRFYGAGTSLQLDGDLLESPLIYHVEGTLPDSFDASLIESGLPVAKTRTNALGLPYWPSYRGCSPSQRRRYRSWLTSGRCDPEVELGYVFIYFYGLERRVIVDGADHGPVAREVLRLQSIYNCSNSFRRYSTSFLWLIVLTASQGEISNDLLVEVASRLDHWNEPNRAALLSAFCVRQMPLPAKAAFIVAEHEPGSPRGVVVRRHRDRLWTLFEQRYRAQFGDGLVLRAAAKPAKFEYRPASESLLGLWYDHPLNTILIPNVLGVASQLKPLIQLWASVVDELRGFDRAQRKTGGHSMTAEMYEALPTELRVDDHPDFDLWYSVMSRYTTEDMWVLVPISELAGLRGIPQRTRLTRKQCEDLLGTADAMHLSVEPDARETGQQYRWTDRVSLFPNDDNGSSNLSHYHAASVLLRLGLTIATADGVIDPQELATITKHLQEQFDLSVQDSTRLDHLAYLLTHTEADALHVGRKLSSLPLDQRRVIGNFLVAVAAADEVITSEEVGALRRAYRSIGLDVTALDSLSLGRVQSEGSTGF